MIWITEEDFNNGFVQITAGDVYRDLKYGYFYVKQDNYLSPLFTAYSESGNQPISESYIIQSKSMIINEILKEL